MGNKPDVYRWRTRGGLTPMYANLVTTNADCAHLYAWTRWGPTDLLYGWQGTTEYCQDWVTPGFARRSASGEVLIKPYEKVVETHTCVPGAPALRTILPSCTSPATVYATEDYSGPWLYTGMPGGPTKMTAVKLISDTEIDSLVGLAATKAWSASNSSQAGVLQDIAEMRQTINMLRNPLKAQWRLLSKIIQPRKGVRVLGTKRSPKHWVVSGEGAADWATSNWLMYRYGVRPLVSSIKGVLEALNAEQKAARWTARGISSLSSSNVTSGTISRCLCSHNWTQTDTDEITIRAGVLLEEDIELSSRLGFTAGQMLALPWELVPYSFVADWFVNVNDYLSGLAAYRIKRPLGSWWTVTRRQRSHWTVGTIGPNAPASYTMLRGGSEWRAVDRKTKSRYLGLPAPSLERKLSATKVLTDARLVDSFSLLIQGFSRVFK